MFRWNILLGCSFVLFGYVSGQNVVPEKEPAELSYAESSILLQQYVSIPSETGNESAAGQYLAGICEERGLTVHHFVDTAGGYNFVASLYPLESQKPNIIFLNHIDVVSPGDPAEWDSPPYEGTFRDGKIFGRGSIDNKGLAIVQMMAVSDFVEKAMVNDFPYNVSVLCVSGEETGGVSGSGIVSQKFMDELNAEVVIGEGGCGIINKTFGKNDTPLFGISIAEKSMLWLELQAEVPVAGHASVNVGDYANKRLVDGLHSLLSKRHPVRFNPASRLMFRELGKKTGGLKGFVLSHVDWFIFKPFLKGYIKREPQAESLLCDHVTLTNLCNPPGSMNQYVQKATALLDCRLLPGTTSDEMIRRIERKVNDTSIHIRTVFHGPASLCTTPDMYFMALEASILEVYPDAMVIPVFFPASNDNNYYRARGIPTYGINPFILSMDQIRSIHNINENIDAAEIIRGINVYKHFIAEMIVDGHFR